MRPGRIPLPALALGLTLLAATTVAHGQGATPSPERSIDDLDRGRLLLDAENDARGAARLFEDLARRSSGARRGEALVALGDARSHLGDDDGARAAWNEAARDGGRFAEIARERLRLQEAGVDPELARRIQRAIRRLLDAEGSSIDDARRELVVIGAPAVPFIGDALRDQTGDQFFSSQLMRAIVEIGGASAARFLEATAAGDVILRRSVVWSLTDLKSELDAALERHPEMRPAVAAFLADEDENTRVRALDLLSLADEMRLSPTLLSRAWERMNADQRAQLLERLPGNWFQPLARAGEDARVAELVLQATRADDPGLRDAGFGRLVDSRWVRASSALRQEALAFLTQGPPETLVTIHHDPGRLLGALGHDELTLAELAHVAETWGPYPGGSRTRVSGMAGGAENARHVLESTATKVANETPDPDWTAIETLVRLGYVQRLGMQLNHARPPMPERMTLYLALEPGDRNKVARTLTDEDLARSIAALPVDGWMHGDDIDVLVFEAAQRTTKAATEALVALFRSEAASYTTTLRLAEAIGKHATLDADVAVPLLSAGPKVAGGEDAAPEDATVAALRGTLFRVLCNRAAAAHAAHFARAYELGLPARPDAGVAFLTDKAPAGREILDACLAVGGETVWTHVAALVDRTSGHFGDLVHARLAGAPPALQERILARLSHADAFLETLSDGDRLALFRRVLESDWGIEGVQAHAGPESFIALGPTFEKRWTPQLRGDYVNRHAARWPAEHIGVLKDILKGDMENVDLGAGLDRVIDVEGDAAASFVLGFLDEPVHFYALAPAVRVPDPRIVERLIEVLRHPREDIRDRARRSLEEIDLYLEQKRKWDERLSGGVGDAAAAAAKLLVQVREGATLDVRVAAIRALGVLGRVEVLPTLVDLVSSPEPRIAEAANAAVERLTTK